MRRLSRRVLAVLTTAAALVLAVAGLAWVSLTHEPSFYREMVRVPRERREARAKRFVSHSLQLRNDIANESRWEAVFSDEEVNAWLAEDLVEYFADQLPPEVHEPRVLFEMDRVTLAFELDERPIKSVVWVVATPRVPEDNVLELTFEKIRAGMLPVPADRVLDRIVTAARARGLDVAWKRVGNLPVATIRYTPHSGRSDVKLERVQILKGEIRLAGRSDRVLSQAEALTLPTREVLQAKFPKRKIHFERRSVVPSTVPEPVLRSSTVPTS
ncbi:MAG: hypothetical protein U0835_14525 [Isosphaeraceae bacterium]